MNDEDDVSQSRVVVATLRQNEQEMLIEVTGETFVGTGFDEGRARRLKISGVLVNEAAVALTLAWKTIEALLKRVVEIALEQPVLTLDERAIVHVVRIEAHTVRAAHLTVRRPALSVLDP